MQTCPTCGADYPDSELYCIQDGSALIAATASSPVVSRAGLPKEAIVGLALAALALVVVTGAFVAQKSRQFRLVVVFNEGQNIQRGDSVFVQGNRAGSIESTRFEDGAFYAVIAVRNDARPYLRSDSIFYVGVDQLLTNKRCIAVATGSDFSSPPLESGQMVRGYTWFGRLPPWAKLQLDKFVKS